MAIFLHVLNQQALIICTFFVVAALNESTAFSSYPVYWVHVSQGKKNECGSRDVTLCMALTPVGPFCPFRSTAALDLDPKMDEFNAGSPDFASEMTRFQVDLQMGNTPDPERLLKVADEIDKSVDMWEKLVTRLRLSPDFQTREYAKLTQAHLACHGVTIESVASMMRWQSGCMRAMAKNTPPPMPPPDMDLLKMMEQSKSEKPPPSVTAMAAAEQIKSNPFKGTEKAFESPTVKAEYERLCRDHLKLIEFGSRYDSFDPLGKLRYLDEIENVEERWDIFFTRFSLMGTLNEDFVKQCNAFLDSMGMDEEGYRKLLKKCHQIMRADAEAERARLGG
jgi:hypothetical protein